MTKLARHVAAMSRAIDLATRGPVADPNPRVGCVVLGADGSVVGEGWHRGAGTPHAEVAALQQAGAAARGATAVVTLEPCAHTGRTGPCYQALLDAGVETVVFAAPDPTVVAGGGAQLLREAGVEVQGGVLEAVAQQVNDVWLTSMRLGRPVVTWKYAMTADGFSSASDGTSQWITGAAARADVHRLRAECGAILVGTGTVLADNPHLTVRSEQGALHGSQPLRVVMGEREIPADFRVRDSAAPTWFTGTRDIPAVLSALFEQGVRHVWLEGGAHLAQACLDAGVVDRVITYVAPAVLGSGLAPVAGAPAATMSSLRRGTIRSVSQHGTDVRIVWEFSSLPASASESGA